MTDRRTGKAGTMAFEADRDSSSLVKVLRGETSRVSPSEAAKQAAERIAKAVAQEREKIHNLTDA